MCSSLCSELAVFYLDDGTIGGDVEELSQDLDVVVRMSAEVGLELNNNKTEIICSDPTTVDSILSLLSASVVIDPSKASLLGPPIGDLSSVSVALESKVEMLQRLGDRLKSCEKKLPYYLHERLSYGNFFSHDFGLRIVSQALLY